MSLKKEIATALGIEYKRRRALVLWLMRNPAWDSAHRERIRVAKAHAAQLHRLLDRAARKWDR